VVGRQEILELELGRNLSLRDWGFVASDSVQIHHNWDFVGMVLDWDFAGIRMVLILDWDFVAFVVEKANLWTSRAVLVTVHDLDFVLVFDVGGKALEGGILHNIAMTWKPPQQQQVGQPLQLLQHSAPLHPFPSCPAPPYQLRTHERSVQTLLLALSFLLLQTHQSPRPL